MNELTIRHNGALNIAVGKGRKETSWKNREFQWSDLVLKLSATHRTVESHEEYMRAKKSRQDEIKDIGGFVGGFIAGGRRKSGSVLTRQLVTLDADFVTADIWEDFQLLFGNAGAIYSTHKHTPTSKRLRLLIPLSREVETDEYMAIARKIAGTLGIDQFDHTTFQPERLMYWPSTSANGEYVFHYDDADWVNPDEILSGYKDWRDSSEWPVSTREGDVVNRQIKKQGDPLEKTGVIGAFCRSYSIHEAIDTFLPDVYEHCDIESRYTYKDGSTAAGLVTYDDKYAYSHHGTDPVSGKLCNAFDLVRIHKYGLRDEDIREGTPGNRLPSYEAMKEFAASIGDVRKLLIAEKVSEVAEDFGDMDTDAQPEADDGEWTKLLDVDKQGKAKSTVNNIVLILDNDPRLKGKLSFNEFEQRECIVGRLPWPQKEKDAGYFTDADVSGLTHYLEKYGISSGPKIEHALKIGFSKYAFNPIKEYLQSVRWDGVKRVDTLLIDYLGAEDNIYTRSAIRKIMAAAVARVFEPGVKFEYMLTLVGKQGLGKSSFIQKLAVTDNWYSESFSTVHGKVAQESVQGVWIAEMGELAGLRKADVESIKTFIGTRHDRYRVSYGKRTENFPRQCVFFGTTNNRTFLKDPTGNRRFWPIDTTSGVPTKSVFTDLTEDETGQLWAETMVNYRKHEPLYLTKDVEDLAYKAQTEFSEKDDRIGQLEKFLDTPLPESWDEMSVWDRRSFFQGDDLTVTGTHLRDKVCIAEIWSEMLGSHIRDMNANNTKDLHTIMQNMGGWERSKSNLHYSFYGKQRGYIRSKKRGHATGNADTRIKIGVETRKTRNEIACPDRVSSVFGHDEEL